VRTAVGLLSAVASDPARLRRMKDAARRQKVPGAAGAIALELMRFIQVSRKDGAGAIRRESRAVPHLSS
ncbi:MAG: hypothetical protein K6U88_15100, partial [Dehalococcoidia bacterium]|nr:hypothetical protein [Dehalococcoidia bacterium]